MRLIIQMNLIVASVLFVSQWVLAESRKRNSIETGKATFDKFENNVKHNELAKRFQNPPDSARPGVYWHFMDGNLSREEMTADLEAMKEAGIGNLVLLEVNVGVPRGPVDFMSEQWQNLFVHAVCEAERRVLRLLWAAAQAGLGVVGLG
jgi:hypothetical protein